MAMYKNPEARRAMRMAWSELLDQDQYWRYADGSVIRVDRMDRARRHAAIEVLEATVGAVSAPRTRLYQALQAVPR